MRNKLSLYIRKSTSQLRCLPHFLVLGVQKGGTRFLNHLLAQHPDIFLPKKKELHFFDLDEHYQKGLNWYRSFFPFSVIGAKKLVGEVTPRYIFDTKVPERCYQVLPQAKFIVLLRDPVDRAYSHYHQSNSKFRLSMSFEEFINKTTIPIERDGILEQWESQVLEKGCYHEQIQRWYQWFAPEQFLFLESEALFQDPFKSLQMVFDFLELPVIEPKDVTAKNTGNYKEAIDPSIRQNLGTYYRQSNQWLLQQGFGFSWLQKE
ncbi:MAG: sulfotransferase domain-containing protein [Bacteroidota bacterium]